jgi:hypothetical protein
MNITEALFEAKQYLNTATEGRGTSYICIALLDVSIRRPEAKVAVDKATRIIEKRLGKDDKGNSRTAGCWVKTQGLNLSQQELQTWRHMWVDKLIEEFTEKALQDAAN